MAAYRRMRWTNSGWIGGTPKGILRHSPEFTYRRLLDAAAVAKRLGAQIMGLGAFTKVVGARLLAKVAQEVHLVSPETAKLLALKESILRQTPDARLFLSARADKDIADVDRVVTATSGAGRRSLDN